MKETGLGNVAHATQRVTQAHLPSHMTQGDESVAHPLNAPVLQPPDAQMVSQLPSTLMEPSMSVVRLESILSGRGLAVVGALLILFGCGYFLDLSFTHNWIGPLSRVVLGVAAGGILIVVAARMLRGTYRIVAEGAVGLGAGIVYLASWAAIAVFPDLHIPRAAAYAVMIGAACALTAIGDRARSQAIGLMGLGGAYLTPVLLSSPTPDRTMLAVYLTIVTSGAVILSRRRAFVPLEVMAAVGTLAYFPAFWTNEAQHWTAFASALVATTFYAIFAIATTLRPTRTAQATQLRLVPFVATTMIYIIALEAILLTDKIVLESTLLGLGGVLLSAPIFVTSLGRRFAGATRFPIELQAAYHSLGILAFNLGMRELLRSHNVYLLDVVIAQAPVFMLLGKRTGNVALLRIGGALLGLSAVWLISQAIESGPTPQAFTELGFAFLAWIGAAWSVRHAIPTVSKWGFAILTHIVALVGLTRIALDATGGPMWDVHLPPLAQCTLSIAWALFAAGLFVDGTLRRSFIQRCEGLVVFALTILSVLTVTLAGLDSVYRVLVFIASGILIFLSSVLYVRATRVTGQEEQPDIFPQPS